MFDFAEDKVEFKKNEFSLVEKGHYIMFAERAEVIVNESHGQCINIMFRLKDNNRTLFKKLFLVTQDEKMLKKAKDYVLCLFNAMKFTKESRKFKDMHDIAQALLGHEFIGYVNTYKIEGNEGNYISAFFDINGNPVNPSDKPAEMKANAKDMMKKVEHTFSTDEIPF